MLSILELILRSFFLISHISSGSFPQPLSEEEEKHYLQLYQQGDVEAKNVLIERNLRLVAHIVKKYAGCGHDSDDLLSIGTIGLIKGISTYDCNKKTKLSTYAARCIHNEILMVLRGSKHCFSEISLQEAIGYDKEGNEVALIDILPAYSEDIGVDFENKIQVKNLYASIKKILKQRERTIVELRYGFDGGNGLTQREIAEKLGISRSYVSKLG